jgi:hypothetical protein
MLAWPRPVANCETACPVGRNGRTQMRALVQLLPTKRRARLCRSTSSDGPSARQEERPVIAAKGSQRCGRTRTPSKASGKPGLTGDRDAPRGLGATRGTLSDPVDRAGNACPSDCGRLARRAIFRFTGTPNQWLNSGRPVPTRGAVARRHERGMGCGGRGSVRRATWLQGGLAKGL